MSSMLTILCDLDGVVADLMTPFLERYNKEFPRADGTFYTIDDITDHDLTKCLPDGRKAIEWFSEPGCFSNLREFPAAIMALNELSKNHNVVIVTKPARGNSASDKINWVKEHLGNVEVITATKKWRIKGDILIDDAPENLRAYSAVWPDSYTIGIQYPYNSSKDCDFYVRGHTDMFKAWDTIGHIIKAITLVKSKTGGF